MLVNVRAGQVAIVSIDAVAVTPGRQNRSAPERKQVSFLLSSVTYLYCSPSWIFGMTFTHGLQTVLRSNSYVLSLEGRPGDRKLCRAPRPLKSVRIRFRLPALIKVWNTSLTWKCRRDYSFFELSFTPQSSINTSTISGSCVLS
jgi:hypothetical protein